MDRTSAQPQVNLSLLNSNPSKFQPQEIKKIERGWGGRGGGVRSKIHITQRRQSKYLKIYLCDCLRSVPPRQTREGRPLLTVETGEWGLKEYK